MIFGTLMDGRTSLTAPPTSIALASHKSQSQITIKTMALDSWIAEEAKAISFLEVSYAHVTKMFPAADGHV